MRYGLHIQLMYLVETARNRNVWAIRIPELRWKQSWFAYSIKSAIFGDILDYSIWYVVLLGGLHWFDYFMSFVIWSRRYYNLKPIFISVPTSRYWYSLIYPTSRSTSRTCDAMNPLPPTIFVLTYEPSLKNYGMSNVPVKRTLALTESFAVESIWKACRYVMVILCAQAWQFLRLDSEFPRGLIKNHRFTVLHHFPAACRSQIMCTLAEAFRPELRRDTVQLPQYIPGGKQQATMQLRCLSLRLFRFIAVSDAM